MKSLMRPALPTASAGTSQAPSAAVDNPAPVQTRSFSLICRGLAVQTSRAASTFLVATALFISCVSPALACRGPFSFSYLLGGGLEAHEEVYWGTVQSVTQHIVSPGTPMERTEWEIQLSVIQAWQPRPAAAITVRNVFSQEGGAGGTCLSTAYPKVGEKWLVVAVRKEGFLRQSDIKAIRVSDRLKGYENITRAIDLQRPKRYKPSHQRTGSD